MNVYLDTNSIMAPAKVHIPVTPSDTDNVEPHKVIYVGTGGDVAIVDAEGTEHTYTVADNSRLDFSATQIKATGTTASGIVLWA